MADGRDTSDAVPRCIICLGSPPVRAAFAEPCMHGPFCFEHLDQWLGRSSTCPLCKRRVTSVLTDARSEYEYLRVLYRAVDRGESEEGPDRVGGAVRSTELPVLALYPARRYVYDRMLSAWMRGASGAWEKVDDGASGGLRGVSGLLVAALRECLTRDLVALMQEHCVSGGSVEVMRDDIWAAAERSGEFGAAFISQASKWIGERRADELARELRRSLYVFLRLPLAARLSSAPRPARAGVSPEAWDRSLRALLLELDRSVRYREEAEGGGEEEG